MIKKYCRVAVIIMKPAVVLLCPQPLKGRLVASHTAAFSSLPGNKVVTAWR